MLLENLAHAVGIAQAIVSLEDRVNASKLLDCVITCVGHKDVWPWHSRDHTLLLKHFPQVIEALQSVAGLTDADMDFERAQQAICAVLALKVVCLKRLKRTLVPTSLSGTTRPRDERILNHRHCPASHRVPRCSPGPLDVCGTAFACQCIDHNLSVALDADMLHVESTPTLNHKL